MILEDIEGKPKVKLYKDENGRFKGEALVVYLQEASVELACRLFDETELVLGSGDKVISVKAAEWDNSKKEKADGADKGEGSSKGNGAKGKPDQLKARQGRKAAALRQCVLPLLLCQSLADESVSQETRRLVGRRRPERGRRSGAQVSRRRRSRRNVHPARARG